MRMLHAAPRIRWRKYVQHGVLSRHIQNQAQQMIKYSALFVVC